MVWELELVKHQRGRKESSVPALEILISVYVVGMLRVLYGFGTVIGVLMAKKPKEQVLETFDTPQGEGRGGYPWRAGLRPETSEASHQAGPERDAYSNFARVCPPQSQPPLPETEASPSFA